MPTSSDATSIAGHHPVKAKPRAPAATSVPSCSRRTGPKRARNGPPPARNTIVPKAPAAARSPIRSARTPAASVSVGPRTAMALNRKALVACIRVVTVSAATHRGKERFTSPMIARERGKSQRTCQPSAARSSALHCGGEGARCNRESDGGATHRVDHRGQFSRRIEPSPGEMIGFGSKGHSFRRQSTSQVDLHHLGPNPAI